MDMKTCTECYTEKPLSEYYKDNSKPDGLRIYCKACIKAKSSKYYAESEHYKQNKDKRYAYVRNHYKQNRDKYIAYGKQYQKTRRAEDRMYALISSLRCRISNLMNGRCKSKRTLEIIGLPLNEFKAYLEGQWSEGMSWSNYGYGEGKWVIDHKQPLASATSEDEMIALNHHTNLQPMWWRDNVIKGDRAEH